MQSSTIGIAINVCTLKPVSGADQVEDGALSTDGKIDG